jgi:endonuclease YncB( thermonuclease family)
MPKPVPDRQYLAVGLVLFSLLFMVLGLTSKSYSCDSNFENVKYLGNYDGDTIKFDIEGVHPLLGDNINVRVFGIDTPEIRAKTECEKKRAVESKEYVRNELGNSKKIQLIDCKRGKYFRIVCRVVYDEIDLSTRLLKLGLAIPYDGGSKPQKDWCK